MSSRRVSLATGFRNVDISGDTDACTRCLDLIGGIPFFHRVKRHSFDVIEQARPRRVLDAGCGTGADLVELARVLPGPCEITGLDASGALLAKAKERTEGLRDRCQLVRGDIIHSPFCTGTFDACRIDRVLQHLEKPVPAIRELTRILAPGGMLVAFDNDWDTFSLSLDDHRTAARISRSWRDSFASGRVGRDLFRIFRECGLADVREAPRTLVLDDLPTAEQVFDLAHLLDRMVHTGTLTAEERSAVSHELALRAREGTFSSGYTGYLVQGIKPD